MKLEWHFADDSNSSYFYAWVPSSQVRSGQRNIFQRFGSFEWMKKICIILKTPTKAKWIITHRDKPFVGPSFESKRPKMTQEAFFQYWAIFLSLKHARHPILTWWRNNNLLDCVKKVKKPFAFRFFLLLRPKTFFPPKMFEWTEIWLAFIQVVPLSTHEWL